MSVEKKIAKREKQKPAFIPLQVDHAREIDKIIDTQLEGIVVPTDYKDKMFYVRIYSNDTGETSSGIVEGRYVTAKQYKMLFACQHNVSSTYKGIDNVVERQIATYFMDKESNLSRLEEYHADKINITWDRETLGSWAQFEESLPEADKDYRVIDSEY